AGGAVRAQLERRAAQEGIGPLLDELRAVDPESAQRLNPNDQKRIIRALEVWRETGKTITQHNLDSRRVPPRYDAVYLGFAFEDRQDMRDRIDARVEQMAEQGLLDEVRALLKRGVPRGSTALQAIGYKECLSFLDGQSTEEEALELIKLRSRQYAKRQLTWLRRNQDIHWFYWKKTRDFQAALAFSTEILRQRGVS
ncbi:MAG: tRNA (adenosine(37)-N6)-dimethylallyltransferase MiaA, partial [Oscillospiraceae bacterium]|nr:tRNA (adenosine(37)-N6)-dimethylallyltransferase MiaA [Oscillospiraceae bacterium]